MLTDSSARWGLTAPRPPLKLPPCGRSLKSAARSHIWPRKEKKQHIGALATLACRATPSPRESVPRICGGLAPSLRSVAPALPRLARYARSPLSRVSGFALVVPLSLRSFTSLKGGKLRGRGLALACGSCCPTAAARLAPLRFASLAWGTRSLRSLVQPTPQATLCRPWLWSPAGAGACACRSSLRSELHRWRAGRSLLSRPTR